VSVVGVGLAHTCAVSTGGGVKCWGLNSYGQLGNDSTTDSHVPVDVQGLSAGVSAISASDTHYTCAVSTGGGVKCWGLNSNGQLGNNSTTDSHVPVDVQGLSAGVNAISAGSAPCALSSGGGVKCWGSNFFGGLGNNSTTDSHVPVDVQGLSAGVNAISARAQHTCALLSGGGVRCWGANGHGQLGTNSTTTSAGIPYTDVPTEVPGLGAGVKAISAGGEHTCALLSGGGVKCWGRNDDNQLGNNSFTESVVPVDVQGLGGVSAISAGTQHTCALLSGGGVKCWGQNSYGQLGNNTFTDSDGPVDVEGLGGVSAIHAGSFHTCALLSRGGVKCWGHNLWGQLGNNSTTHSSIPVDVVGLP
jgi:alpha-tubulin suppressor-like RCC1 family protein